VHSLIGLLPPVRPDNAAPHPDRFSLTDLGLGPTDAQNAKKNHPDAGITFLASPAHEHRGPKNAAMQRRARSPRQCLRGIEELNQSTEYQRVASAHLARNP